MTVFRKKLHTNVQHVYNYTISQGNSLIKYSLYVQTTEHKWNSLFLDVFKIMGTKIFHGKAEGEFRGRRTGPRPPSQTRREIWACHRPLPPSISRWTGTSICSYVIQFFGRCSFPPFCASLCGSGTRFSPVSRTSSGMWRSRCASAWRGTCWR